jgi:hypothetical protein
MLVECCQHLFYVKKMQHEMVLINFSSFVAEFRPIVHFRKWRQNVNHCFVSKDVGTVNKISLSGRELPNDRSTNGGKNRFMLSLAIYSLTRNIDSKHMYVSLQMLIFGKCENAIQKSICLGLIK